LRHKFQNDATTQSHNFSDTVACGRSDSCPAQALNTHAIEKKEAQRMNSQTK